MHLNKFLNTLSAIGLITCYSGVSASLCAAAQTDVTSDNAAAEVAPVTPAQPVHAAQPIADISAQTETTTPDDSPMAAKADFVRVCGICHLENGEGVPGAFPPLDRRLAVHTDTETGRNYLTGLLKNGLYGKITVNGTSYNGAMPALASQLTAEEIAGLLNYSLQTFADKKANFTADEITSRSKAVGTTAGATLRKQTEF